MTTYQPKRITSSTRLILQVLVDNQDPTTGQCSLTSPELGALTGLSAKGINNNMILLKHKHVLVTYPAQNKKLIYVIGGHEGDSLESKKELMRLGVKHPTLFAGIENTNSQNKTSL